jgi:hypothetical protein
MGVKLDRGEYRLTAFENRVLRRILIFERNEVIGSRRKLNSEEHYNFYLSPNIVRMIKLCGIRWAGYVECTGEKYSYKVFEGRLRKMALGRLMIRWEIDTNKFWEEIFTYSPFTTY